MVDLDLPAADEDATTAHLVDLLVAAGRVTDHLKVLSAPSRRLIHESFRTGLHNAKDPEQVVELFNREVAGK